MLPTREKIFEVAIRQQVEKYFNDNNLIAKEQSGFRDKHSCNAVFLDLSRAFETVNGTILRKNWKITVWGVQCLIS